MYSVPVYILHTCDLCKALNWCLICENNYLKTLTKLIKKKETTIKDGGIHLKLLDYQRHTSNWNPLWIIDYLRIIEFLWIIKVHTFIWNDFQTIKVMNRSIHIHWAVRFICIRCAKWRKKETIEGVYQAHARSARARRACALRALGLLLADGTPTVGGGKTFWRVN